MRLGKADESGRRRPVPVNCSEFFVRAGMVLAAIGESADFDGWPEELERDGGVVPVDGFGATYTGRRLISIEQEMASDVAAD